MSGVGAFLSSGSRREAKTPIENVCLPSQQPRRYFGTAKMVELTQSVKTHGILEPLLVRPLKDGKYELVAGERRLRAAKEAGLTEVPIVVRELDDKQALELALVENLQREDLNPVEETEGVLDLLSIRLGKSREEMVTLLNMAANPHRKSVHNVMHSDEWLLVEELFGSIGRFTPNSFRANRLPLLKLAPDILNALRQNQIEYTKALVIARLKDAKQRKALLKEAIDGDLSLAEIKERIKQLKADTEKPDRGEVATLNSRIDKTYRRLKKSKLLDDPKKKKRLEKLLTELESLLDGN
ncbi:MAG: ParB/RepB/Spo0J family partition protein [Symploca sp. SIO2G7]|nr:ParB/RepB/Spo0J family partition protein [Symploca sp. SIO2G7]